MPFDSTFAYRDDLQDKYSQQGERGPNHNNDCVPATFSNIMHAYGFLHTQPSWWDVGEYPAGYLGPTSYAAQIDWMKKNPEDFPNPPEVRISNPVDTLIGIDGAGQAGFAVAVNLYSDGNGVPQPRVTGILHVVAVVKIVPNAVTILNPEHNTLETYDFASFKLMTQGKDAGWLAVFARPLPTAPVVVKPPPVPVVVPPPPPPLPPPIVVPDYKAQLDAAALDLVASRAEAFHLKKVVDDDTLQMINLRQQLVAAQAELDACNAARIAAAQAVANKIPIPSTQKATDLGGWLRRLLGGLWK